MTSLSGFLLIGCAATAKPPVVIQNPLLSGLVGRGAVTLSKDNPYIASNLFLSKQMEKSPELKGFIEHKGAPNAIEVQEGKISDAMIVFYYPQSNESYELEDAQDTWVIRGPFPLQHDKQAELTALSKSGDTGLTSVALVQMPGKITGDDPRARAGMFPFESPSMKPELGSTESLQQTLDTSKVKEFLKVSPQADAELTPKGDLVHYVTEPNETVDSIARWYSFDSENSDKLARINRVKSKDALEVGETVVVPSYMVKNKARLTSEGLKIINSQS